MHCQSVTTVQKDGRRETHSKPPVRVVTPFSCLHRDKKLWFSSQNLRCFLLVIICFVSVFIIELELAFVDVSLAAFMLFICIF